MVLTYTYRWKQLKAHRAWLYSCWTAIIPVRSGTNPRRYATEAHSTIINHWIYWIFMAIRRRMCKCDCVCPKVINRSVNFRRNSVNTEYPRRWAVLSSFSTTPQTRINYGLTFTRRVSHIGASCAQVSTIYTAFHITDTFIISSAKLHSTGHNIQRCFRSRALPLSMR